MVNPGAFHGSRLKFLQSQKPAYAEAILLNMAADCVADIQRKFFKRFPLDSDEDDDPSAESLAAVDDDSLDPDVLAPDEDALSPEEYELALQACDDRTKLIISRRKVSVLPFDSNNLKLTHEMTANQTLDGISAVQGPPVVVQIGLLCHRLAHPPHHQTHWCLPCETPQIHSL